MPSVLRDPGILSEVVRREEGKGEERGQRREDFPHPCLQERRWRREKLIIILKRE